jgi:hypothetical protein
VRGAGATAEGVELPAGMWAAERIDPKTGAPARTAIVAGGGVRQIEAPAYDTDIALRLVKQ